MRFWRRVYFPVSLVHLFSLVFSWLRLGSVLYFFVYICCIFILTNTLFDNEFFLITPKTGAKIQG